MSGNLEILHLDKNLQTLLMLVWFFSKTILLKQLLLP